MSRRSTRRLAALVGAAWVLTHPAFGDGAHWPWEPLIASEDVGFAAVAAGFEYVHRLVDVDGVGRRRFVARCGYGTLSLDLARWLTVFGGAGETEARFPNPRQYGQEELLWLVGARASLWEFPITSPAFLASRIRFQAGLTSLHHRSDLEPGSLEWSETRTALLVRAERLAENWRRLADPAPYSLTLYAGPVWSVLDGKLEGDAVVQRWGRWSTTFEENHALGVTGGATLWITRRLSAGAEARWTRRGDRPSLTAELALHF